MALKSPATADRNNKWRSITASGRSEPFYLQVARGVIAGHYTVNANGYNPAASTSKEATWPHSAVSNWPATASVMKVSSNSANDALAGPGSGAQTLTIFGLDSNWDLVEETVDLQGTTDFTTTTSFIRINRLKVETFGSGDTNAGIISVYTGADTAGLPDVSTTVFGTIAVGDGESLMAHYSVPRYHTAYVIDVSMNAFVVADEYTTMTLEYRENADEAAGGWNTLEKLDIASQFYLLYACPPYIEQQSDIVLNSDAQASATRVSGSFNLIVIKDVYDSEVV